MITDQEFVAIVRQLYADHQKVIDGEKIESLKRSKEPNLIWEIILSSFSTWGGSRGSALMTKPEFHDPIRYAALSELSDEQQKAAIASSLSAAGVRYPKNKLKLLLQNLTWIRGQGGPEAVWQILQNQPGVKGKITFLDKKFGGIGPKYARNMMMDLCHPDFQDSIAIDQRIKNISKALGRSVSPKDYAAEEEFYLGIAKLAGLTGWELDRLLYRFHETIVSWIKERSQRTLHAASPTHD